MKPGGRADHDDRHAAGVDTFHLPALAMSALLGEASSFATCVVVTSASNPNRWATAGSDLTRPASSPTGGPTAKMAFTACRPWHRSDSWPWAPHCPTALGARLGHRPSLQVRVTAGETHQCVRSPDGRRLADLPPLRGRAAS